MIDNKQIMTCETLEQVSHASGTVKYVPHAPIGQWPVFQQWADNEENKLGWDIPTALRALVAYLFLKPATPLVISTFHDSCLDDTPSYRVICYNVTYNQLISMDEHAQPSWFNVYIAPDHELYTVTLVPTRSLMKLLYKMVI